MSHSPPLSCSNSERLSGSFLVMKHNPAKPERTLQVVVPLDACSISLFYKAVLKTQVQVATTRWIMNVVTGLAFADARTTMNLLIPTCNTNYLVPSNLNCLFTQHRPPALSLSLCASFSVSPFSLFHESRRVRLDQCLLRGH